MNQPTNQSINQWEVRGERKGERKEGRKETKQTIRQKGTSFLLELSFGSPFFFLFFSKNIIYKSQHSGMNIFFGKARRFFLFFDKETLKEASGSLRNWLKEGKNEKANLATHVKPSFLWRRDNVFLCKIFSKVGLFHFLGFGHRRFLHRICLSFLFKMWSNHFRKGGVEVFEV